MYKIYYTVKKFERGVIMSLVLTEIKENIGCITLNNPRKRNAFSEELLVDMLSAIADFEQKKIPVVVLRAEKNAKVWSAGHDVTELPKSRRDPLPYYSPLEKALRVVQYYPGAVIAMVQGGVWGGACDLVITVTCNRRFLHALLLLRR